MGRHFATDRPAVSETGMATGPARAGDAVADRGTNRTRTLEWVLAIITAVCAVLLTIGTVALVLTTGAPGCSMGTRDAEAPVAGDAALQAGVTAGEPAVHQAATDGAQEARGESGSVGQTGGSTGIQTDKAAEKTTGAPSADVARLMEPARLAPELYPVLTEQTYSKVTFSAVGDNLMHMPVVNEADANAGGVGDGWYDFTPMYAGVADIVASHDLNFIDQETILGGDYLGFSGYPTFNSPSAIAGQVAGFGWNLVTTATNHSWDMGLEGVLNSCSTWTAQPTVVETGTFASWEDRGRIRTIERNGISFAFLAYTDYLNGFILPEDVAYAIAWADADAMASDVARAHEIADVVIVAMSWGEENETVPNDSQRWFAQHLANLGVDLVVGFGPHVIQPIEWFQGYGPDGAPLPKQMLCVFSLGNFLSNQPLAIENVEGCFQCSFERVGNGDVSMCDFVWTPLINHVGGGWHQVYKLKDYPVDFAWIHESLSTTGDPIGYARGVTEQIVGPSGIYIDY